MILEIRNVSGTECSCDAGSNKRSINMTKQL